MKVSNTEEFIRKANIIHKNYYNYDQVEYHKDNIKVRIFCIQHGYFNQTPTRHLQKSGCISCGRDKMKELLKLSNSKIIEKFKKAHNDLYDYSKVEYINNRTTVEIICNIHGSFFQRPDNHIHQKSGCPKCARIISDEEIVWLDSLNIPNNKECRQKAIKIGNSKYYADGFDPITNTIYEFNGDYFHGNPKKFKPGDINKKLKKTFGELYNKTLEKEEALKSVGYNVVSIWESDFLNNNNLI